MVHVHVDRIAQKVFDLKGKECTRSGKIGVELTSKQYYNTSWTKIFLSMNNFRVLVLQKKKATLTIKEQLCIVIFLLM